jgi:hypothetical protein
MSIGYWGLCVVVFGLLYLTLVSSGFVIVPIPYWIEMRWKNKETRAKLTNIGVAYII